MKALLLTDYRRLEVADFPAPTPGPDELLVRVRACGICGSDIHGYDGSSGRRIPPLIMGHEAAGVVEAVGGAVSRFQPGDRVTFDSTVYCGQCAYCRAGQINLCDRRQVLGVSCGEYRRHGAFAEYVVVPERTAVALPEDLSFVHAALVEPVSIAVHAVNRLPIRLGDSAAVVGTGMIGLLVVQALRLAGCGKIVALDVEPRKLALARELGADAALDARDPEAPAQVAAMTGGRGVDVAVEAVGAAAPVQLAIRCLRKGGALGLVGNVTPNIELPLQAVVTRELTLYGSCASQGEYPACLELLRRGAMRVEPLISARIPLEAAPQWFERLYQREPGLLKVIVEP
ncbi:galactitol-1-phosphate 5-dehydrogenase [Fontisphaera persica]|uniref:galactitol-1-phosphate 5-dehydrogenase n=1 Tax=Fontisphaera persica TaxID=2974023 RepID=UPI0024C07C24|nr:galactitol-1-phosphate 5-dehydrogenase [Fontisphaera persica]WCJ60064.1 galactitol-1-phosphate 5-dehydrogenase [Fontisphaera persica]